MNAGIHIDRRLPGILAGITAGISYGTNPLFAKPLLESGVPVLVMLFFRYALSAGILAAWMLLKKESFRASRHEIGLLGLLGVLFAGSSLFLFLSYAYIPSGLATTLVYLYPVFVALIMVFLRFYPSWQTWISIVATFGGILLLSRPSAGETVRLPGIFLAVLSALSYACYLVVVNRSKRIKRVSEHTLTLYALLTGTLLFASLRAVQGGSMLEGIQTAADWGNLLGLALMPTMISMRIPWRKPCRMRLSFLAPLFWAVNEVMPVEMLRPGSRPMSSIFRTALNAAAADTPSAFTLL